MDVLVRENGIEIGMMDEFDVRDACKNGEGRIVRAQRGCKWFPSFLALNKTATEKTRALCVRDAGGAAISSTQREELYSGFREDHTDGPVTSVITVVRRVGVPMSRGTKPADAMLVGELSELIPWRENDRFPRRRFNPDKIPAALFRSEAHYRAAQAAV